MRTTIVLLTITASFLMACIPAMAQFAQSETTPLVKYDSRSNIVGVYDTGINTDSTCHKGKQRLRLVRIKYADDDDAYTIGNLIFADSKGRREEYVFLLNLQELSNVDSKNVGAFIAEGQWYHVGAYRCGAGGQSDPYIYSLEAVPTTGRKKE